MNRAPELLVVWSSPWREFTSAVGPALRRSPPRLRVEAQAGLFPFRGILLAMMMEIAALATAIVYPSDHLHSVTLEASRPTHDVIYFSADELPRTSDLAGAQTGKSGRGGGASMRTARQLIRVARNPEVRDTVADAPQLQLPKSDSLPANLLAYRADAGPAPAEALSLKRAAPRMALAVVPPAAEMPRSELHRTQLAGLVVVPPPVELPRREIARHSIATPSAVVPPPIATPLQITSPRPPLTLPAETVVAPRPEIANAVQWRQQISEFVPRVVAPPVELKSVRTSVRESALSGSPAVVPPPVALQKVQQRTAQSLGNAPVAAPPVDLASIHQSRELQTSNPDVVPPASPSPEPKVKPLTQAVGARGLASSSAAGVVLSPHPGDKPGRPANSEKATLAMAPSGSALPGAGGKGGGTGVEHGSGSGGSVWGASSGAAPAGNGRAGTGASPTGSAPYPGPGGAGNLSKGTPRVPGVSVSGGSNQVTLPSFGAASDPHATARSTVKPTSNAITVVASPRSGGAMNLYGVMQGDRVYTIYITTSIGQASMQFADPASAARPYADELTAPTPVRTELPADLAHEKMVVRYVLDRNGSLRNPQVLNSESGDFESKLLAALSNWKFSPALRGNETVDVNVILGFGVDTK